MFWGLIMEPHRKYTQVVKRPFHISMAALDVLTSDNEPAQVMCCYNGRNYLLCTLRKPDMLQCALDLQFEEGTQVSFAANGNCHVHLTGYLTLEFENDLALDNIPDAEEEDEEVEEEQATVSSGRAQKRSKNQATGSQPPKKKVKADKSTVITSTQQEDSDDDSSDDESVDMSALLLKEGVDEEEDEDDEDYEQSSEEEDVTIGEEEEDDVDDDEDDDDDEEEEDDDDEEMDFDSDSEGEQAASNQKKAAKVNGDANKKGESSKKKVNLNDSKQGKSEQKQSKQLNDSLNREQGKTSKKGKIMTPAKENHPVQKTPGKDQPKTPGKDQPKTPKGKKNDNEQTKTPGKTPKKRTLQGGIIVEDLKEGEGDQAKVGKFVHVYYEGRLKENNKLFDSTNKGTPFKFRLGNREVIKGWDVGVAGMKLGGKRRIICPPSMAYGAKGSPPVIPPNSTLVFDVELKKIT